MKYLRALGIHAALWSGIYWGVIQGTSAVANLTGVAVFLIAMLTVFVSLGCHWVADTDYERLAAVLRRSSLDTVSTAVTRVSVFAIAVVMIVEGNGWLILGTVWLLSMLAMLSVKLRVKSLVDTHCC